MTDDALEFWKDYLIQTRKEIDLEKTEGTKFLNFKIVVIGGMFALANWTVGLLGLLLLPLLMIALDVMQLSRLTFIFDRWEYLSRVVVPAVKSKVLPSGGDFFEEEVKRRHDDGVYMPVEARVRTMLFVPALATSAFSAALLVMDLSKGDDRYAYVAGVIWLVLVCFLALLDAETYSRRVVVIMAVIIAVSLGCDWYFDGDVLNTLNGFRVSSPSG